MFLRLSPLLRSFSFLFLRAVPWTSLRWSLRDERDRIPDLIHSIVLPNLYSTSGPIAIPRLGISSKLGSTSIRRSNFLYPFLRRSPLE
ncbi:hypothetical protein SISNIDRAFT_458465 [Sistotremastrum niveocremeum HHB9708]|uniref:Secreted protein n=1 Tax=Sistotremastrum niveocremeum HHB9708 TaxID=1314777 RepID=A0A164QLQ4_9AGAM|nr:hypothetical protein SISNIDRAFT_458465 [Sistotremastrum niveocremeum HHB9708]